MKRNVDLNEISDGRLYSANDMVKVECGDCAGCSACCQNMGTSVVLDPMDIWKMQRGTGRMLEKLLKKELELNVVDGIILPNLRMNGTREVCSFLNEDAARSIHTGRESAGFFHWADIMRKMDFIIFFKLMNVEKNHVER